METAEELERMAGLLDEIRRCPEDPRLGERNSAVYKIAMADAAGMLSARAAELRAQEKPERVEDGQIWEETSRLVVSDCEFYDNEALLCAARGGTTLLVKHKTLLTDPHWRYVGKEGG